MKISFRNKEDKECFSTAKMGSYFLVLSRLGLWPLSETLRKWSVETVLSTLSQFNNYTVKKLAPSKHSNLCDCHTCAADFQADLQIVVVEQRSLLKGLCLTCAAAGRPSAATGNCETKLLCSGANSIVTRVTNPAPECERPVETA